MVLRIVVAESQMVLVGDVPVQTGEELVVVLICRKTGVTARIVAILRGHIVRHSLQVCLRGTRHVVVGISGIVGIRALPAVHHRRLLHHFAVDEEEQLVLDDRSTQRETIGRGAVFLAGAIDRLVIDGITLHVLVLVVDVSRTLESVGTRLRDGVHTTTDEVGLTHVVRRNHHLQLLNGIDRDRIATAREVGGQTEVIVEVGTIDREVSRTTVSTGETHAVTSVRRQAGEVGDATRYGRHVRDLGTRDVGRSTGLLSRKLGSLTTDHHFGQFVGILREPYGEVVSLGQLKHNTLHRLRLEADVGHRHLVRATGTHTLNRETAGSVGHRCVTSTGGLVDSNNSSTDDLLTVSVVERHLSCHTRSCNLSYGCQRERQQRNYQQKQSFLHKIRTVLIN